MLQRLQLREREIEFNSLDDPGKAPDKQGYIFDYWALASTEEEFDFNSDVPVRDMTLVAKYHKYEYSGITNTWIVDSSGSLRFRFQRYEHIFRDVPYTSSMKALFIANNRQLFIDDKLLEESQYEAEDGSLIIDLKDSCLNRLSPGTHKLSVRFKDGEVSAAFIVKERSKPSTPDYVIPKTGN